MKIIRREDSLTFLFNLARCDRRKIISFVQCQVRAMRLMREKKWEEEEKRQTCSKFCCFPLEFSWMKRQWVRIVGSLKSILSAICEWSKKIIESRSSHALKWTNIESKSRCEGRDVISWKHWQHCNYFDERLGKIISSLWEKSFDWSETWVETHELLRKILSPTKIFLEIKLKPAKDNNYSLNN